MKTVTGAVTRKFLTREDAICGDLRKMEADIERLRLEANRAYANGDYVGAVYKYTEAIKLCDKMQDPPECMCTLYNNRCIVATGVLG